MATKIFKEESPYKTYSKTPQQHHETDYKHLEYLLNSGIKLRSVENVPQNMKILNVALFGAGRAGSIHLVNIMKNTRMNLKYVVDESKARLAQLQQEWNFKDENLLGSDKVDEILMDSSLHAVIICTPTYTHEPLIKKALQTNKAVFCEKPIGETEVEVVNCYDLAKKTGNILFCAFNRRFDPLFSQLQARVRAGEIGEVHAIKTVARDSPLPTIDYLKISGGIFHDCLVHDIDLICWILGEYPTEVVAAASTFIPEIKEINDYDTVAATLKFKSGVIATIDVSRNAVYGYDQQIEAFGPKGVLRARNESPYPLILEDKDGHKQIPIYHSFPSRYNQAYVNEIEQFCDIVQGIKPNTITKENTLNVSTIASALEKSVKTGSFVKVDLINE